MPSSVCYAPGCSNVERTGSGISFFRFPREPARFHKWLGFCGLEGRYRVFNDLSKNATVCISHFEKNQYYSGKVVRLLSTAVPTIHSNGTVVEQQQRQSCPPTPAPLPPLTMSPGSMPKLKHHILRTYARRARNEAQVSAPPVALTQSAQLSSLTEAMPESPVGLNIKRYDIKYERAKFGSLWMKDNSCTVTEIEVEPDLTAMELREDSDDEENAPCGSSEMTAGTFSRGETSQIVVIPKQEVVQDEDHLGSVKESTSISEHFGDVTHKISVGDMVTTPVPCTSTTEEDSPLQSENVGNKFQSVWLRDFHMDPVQVKEEPADYDSDVEDNAEQELMAEVKTEVDMEEPPDVKEADVQRDPSSQAAKPRRQKIFNCLHCGEVFSSLPEITEHVKTHPKMDSHICSKCNKSFSTLVQLDRLMSVQLKRMWSHMERQTYKCKECGRLFSSGLYLRKHETTHKEDRTAYKCTDCDESST